MLHKLTLVVRTLFCECDKPRVSPILNDVTMIDIDQSKTTISYALLLIHDRKVSRNNSYVYEFIRRRFQKFHRTFHTCMNSYVEDFLRVSNQTRLKKYMYVKFREWYCIMIHVWKVTRMKSYTYWILSSDWCIVIHVYILSRNFWYVLRFIRVTFYTCNLWRILSTSANHRK